MYMYMRNTTLMLASVPCKHGTHLLHTTSIYFYRNWELLVPNDLVCEEFCCYRLIICNGNLRGENFMFRTGIEIALLLGCNNGKGSMKTL